MNHTYTYGVLPPCKVFFDCWDKELNDEVDMRFGNDPRFGNGFYNKYQVWDELNKCISEGTDKALDWASCVLLVLGIEWVLATKLRKCKYKHFNLAC